MSLPTTLLLRARSLPAYPAHQPARRALASFDHCNEDPHPLADLDPAAEGGVRWVPYLEQGQPDTPQQAQPAPQSDFPSPEGVAASPRPSTQSLLKRARAMVARRTTEQPE